MKMFKNRIEAGRKLAKLLEGFKDKDVVIYALPRGGVIVGAEIAEALQAPLDLIITRKIGHPNNPEYAIGAIAENGHLVSDKEKILSIDEQYIKEEAEKQTKEVKRRKEAYLKGRLTTSCKGKIAILVDDGIATGLTMKAAIYELQTHYQPSKIIVAVPVAPRGIAEELKREGVTFVAIDIPEDFLGAIGTYYQDFSAVSDEDVTRIMRKINR